MKLHQQNFASHHCGALSFFYFFYYFKHPPVHFVDHELTGTKKIKKASLTGTVALQSLIGDPAATYNVFKISPRHETIAKETPQFAKSMDFSIKLRSAYARCEDMERKMASSAVGIQLQRSTSLLFTRRGSLGLQITRKSSDRVFWHFNADCLRFRRVSVALDT